MIVIENRYKIGEIVYLKTDIDQYPRIVQAFYITIKEIMYELICGTARSTHYDYEISKDKNMMGSI